MFSGSARWDEIARVAEALDIPVIGNGDIKTAHDVVRMKQATNAAGLMIGRGAFGQPWIFRQARALLDGQPMPAAPTVEERFRVALEHAAMVKAYEADPRGAAIEFRKHLGWYAKGLFNAAHLKQRLFQVKDLDEIEPIFADYLAEGWHERHAADEAGDAADDAGATEAAA